MEKASFGTTTQLFSPLHEQENPREYLGKTQRVIWSMETFREQTPTGTTRAEGQEGYQGVSEFEQNRPQRFRTEKEKARGVGQEKQLTENDPKF